MKFRPLFLATLSLTVVQVAFAGPMSSCTQGADASDPSNPGHFLTSFSCTFHTLASNNSPFSLTSFESFNDPTNIGDNYVGSGYLVFTNNTGDSSDEVGWTSVLFFQGDQGGGTTSDAVSLLLPGSFPSFSTVQTADGGSVAPFLTQTGGTYTDGLGLHSYNVVTDQVTTSGTPEPSTLMLVFSAGLAVLGVRRRQKR